LAVLGLAANHHHFAFLVKFRDEYVCGFLVGAEDKSEA
jgi:hypothetical protein